MKETQTSHFWVGQFPEDLAGEYFTESLDESDEDRDQTPLSAFARDQGITGYDLGALEYGRSEASTIQELASGFSHRAQWAEELASRAATAGVSGANFLVFINESEIEQPRSVQGVGYWLHYLGTIEYPIHVGSSPVTAEEENPIPPPLRNEPKLAVTNRTLWLEVMAVLAIGVFPSLSSAIVSAVNGPPAKIPYWLDAFDVSFRALCISFAVLYVIHRSGENWNFFGITRPKLRDLGIGLIILLGDLFLWYHLAPVLPNTEVKPVSFYMLPKGTWDFIWMVIKNAANGFSEELVMRAYLITRLEYLLKSRAQAVVLSALLFASYHIYYGPGADVMFIGIIGLYYGAIYLLLRRVWPLAIAHMLINVILET